MKYKIIALMISMTILVSLTYAKAYKRNTIEVIPLARTTLSNETSENEVSKAKHIVVNAIHDNDLPTEELDKAYKTLLEAAEKNDSSAAYLLGRFHLTHPSAIDYEKAISYLKEASRLENNVASFQLGKLFYFGNEDIERDVRVGLDYLNLASGQGNDYASQMIDNISAHKDFYIAQSSINLMYYLSGLIQNNNSAQRSRPMSIIDKKVGQKARTKYQAYE